MALERSEKRKLRQGRVRRKAIGNDQRPRLSVFRSLHHIYVQVISDESGRTLAAASTETAGLRDELKSKRNLAAAKAVGKAIAEPDPAARDDRLGEALWAESARLVGLPAAQ